MHAMLLDMANVIFPDVIIDETTIKPRRTHPGTMTIIPMFSGRNDEDAQVFLQWIRQAFFELTTPGDDEARIERFECNLEPSSRADRWFKEQACSR